MGERLQHLSTQDALLLCNSFATPTYATPFNHHPVSSPLSLQRYDETLRSIVSDIKNIDLDEAAWTQALLSVKSGGLGVRGWVQLAPSAFLASPAANSDLTHHILPPHFQLTEVPCIEEAPKVWSIGLHLPPVWSCFPPSEVLGRPQSFCHSWHPAEASPRCCVPLPPFGSFNKGVCCMAECPSGFISGIVHGQQHRSCRSWPLSRSTPLPPPHLSPLWCTGWWHCHALSQLQMK